MEQIRITGKVSECQVQDLHLPGRKCHTFHFLKYHTRMLCLAALTMALWSCRPSQDKSSGTADSAMAEYNDFFHSLRAREAASTDDVISLTKEWRRLDLAVLSAMEREKSAPHTAYPRRDYIALTDSIQSQMRRLINSRERGFADYLKAVRQLNDVEMDSVSRKLADAVRQLYRDAGAAGIYQGTAQETVRRYRSLLKKTLSGGLRTRQEILDFLRQEDAAFRSFLHFLPVLSRGKIPLEGITDDTDSVICRIVGLAGTECPVFGKAETVIILTMRNNRRLLQNAEACMENLERMRITDKGQAAAYLWMLLQPWVSFDALAYALMDEGQMRTMAELAVRMPEALERLKAAEYVLDTDALPSLLLETFILGC